MREPLLQITTQQLEYLVAVDRSPTWASAAAKLGVSPSALSQGLAELERRIGVPLFDRHGRKRMLAPAAREVVAYAERVLSQTRDLGRWAASARSGKVGTLRVGMIDLAAVRHFPKAMSGFRSDRPEVDLRLTVAPSKQLIEQLRAAELDLAVIVAPKEAPEDIDLTPLLTEDLAVYAPPDARFRGPSDWGPWVSFPEGSHTRQLIESALADLGAPTSFVAESHQPEVLCEMVRLGMGWTVLPEAQAEGNASLRRVRKQPLLRRQLVLALRSDAIVDPVVEALRTQLSRPGSSDGN
jgi:DNA-binding transcriptional LysR family regulator